MTLSKARREANARWDKKNMTVVGCKITKKKADEFRLACQTLGVTPSSVLRQALEQTIRDAGAGEEGE